MPLQSLSVAGDIQRQLNCYQHWFIGLRHITSVLAQYSVYVCIENTCTRMYDYFKKAVLPSLAGLGKKSKLSSFRLLDPFFHLHKPM